MSALISTGLTLMFLCMFAGAGLYVGARFAVGLDKLADHLCVFASSRFSRKSKKQQEAEK